MTQALLLNNLNNTNIQQDSFGKPESCMQDINATNNVSGNFNKIFDTKIKTVSDMKSSNNAQTNTTELANFKEILTEATDEATMENSLDLTLARDINEVISAIKTTINSDEIETDSENKDLKTNENIFSEVITLLNPMQNDLSQQDDLTCNFNDENINLIQTDLQDENNIIEDLDNFKETPSHEDIIDNDMLSELNIEKIEVKSDSDSSSENTDLMQQQTPQEQGVKAMLNGNDIQFELKTEAQAQNTVQNTKTANTSILEQVSKQMENLSSGSKVNIVLNPESLGKVSIQLINTNEGLSAQFTVATQEAKNALMEGLNNLKNNLIAQGVNVDNVSIKLKEPEETAYKQDWTDQEGSRGGNKNQEQQNRQEKEKGLFEKTITQQTKDIKE